MLFLPLLPGRNATTEKGAKPGRHKTRRRSDPEVAATTVTAPRMRLRRSSEPTLPSQLTIELIHDLSPERKLLALVFTGWKGFMHTLHETRQVNERIKKANERRKQREADENENAANPVQRKLEHMRKLERQYQRTHGPNGRDADIEVLLIKQLVAQDSETQILRRLPIGVRERRPSQYATRIQAPWVPFRKPDETQAEEATDPLGGQSEQEESADEVKEEAAEHLSA